MTGKKYPCNLSIRGACLDQICIKHSQNKFYFFKAKVGLVCFSDDNPLFSYYDT